jgi:hypothetical protein
LTENTITIDLDEAVPVPGTDGAVLKTSDPDMGFIILIIDLPEEHVYESKKYDAFVRTNWQKCLFEHEGRVFGGQLYLGVKRD